MRWMGWLGIGICGLGCAGDDSNTGKPGTEDTGSAPDDTGTDTAEPDTIPQCEAAVIDLVADDLPIPLQRRLTVTLDAPAGAWAVCTADDDPTEVILAESEASGTTHELFIHGLYPNSTWSCEVAAACAGSTPEAIGLQLGSPPPDVPRLNVTSTQPPSDPWTLLNSQESLLAGNQQYVLIVDPQGRPRWIYDVGTVYTVDIDTWWTGDRIHMGGGWGLFTEALAQRGVMIQVDLAGNELVHRELPTFGLGYNHHSEPMPDGEVVSLTTSHNRPVGGGTQWYGVAVERIVPSTGELTWSWDSQQLVDNGTVSPQTGSPWHANALEWVTDPHGDALWISLYEGQAMWRIDRATGERTHVFGPGGDFTLVDPSGTPLPASEWPYSQHDPDVTPDGRILLYDNGVDRPGGAYSRVSEYQLDLDSRVATLLWTWTEPGWYTPIIGDVDYLDDGNVLIAKGVVRLLTLWLDQPSAVIELDPSSGTVVWRMDFDDIDHAVFRAQRYGGCEIFSNAKHCPSVAQRIEALQAR